MGLQAFPPSLLVLSPCATKAGDPSSSVVGINTTSIADGATVYCQENRLTYRLDKQSTASPDGNLILEPIAGPGRWLAQVAGGASGFTGWTDYTPVWSTVGGDASLGDGQVGGKWRQCGVDPGDPTRVTIEFVLSFQWGSTTSGTGEFRFTIPPIGSVDSSALLGILGKSASFVDSSLCWIINSAFPDESQIGMVLMRTSAEFAVAEFGTSFNFVVGHSEPFDWDDQCQLVAHVWLPMILSG